MRDKQEFEKTDVLNLTEKYVQEMLADETTGHDWGHIQRVRQMAVKIASLEGADPWLCEMAALLHDTIDDKITSDAEKAEQEVRAFLIEIGVPHKSIGELFDIIKSISFKGGNGGSVGTLEGKVVQDADRLDAIGAIGIARTFIYSGAKGQAMYDPGLEVREKMTFDQYRNGKSSAVHHFYEKLLKLKDLMNTSYGQSLAEERHRRMESFLSAFYSEWNGES